MMQEFLNNIIPNVMAKLPDFYAAIGDTLLMVVWSGRSRSCSVWRSACCSRSQSRAAFWKTRSSTRSSTSWSACSAPSRSSSC
ncbi:MAG: hypothetical protein ACLR4Z_11495 [Butyricicoccaceae bacterium]